MKRLILLLLTMHCWIAPPSDAAVFEVGAGKTYATISEAIIAASAGDDVLVYSGTYAEIIDWAKPVNIKEAPGQTAVYQSISGGGTPIEVYQWPAGASAVWDGIDMIKADDQYRLLMVYQEGDNSQTVTVKNVTATLASEAQGNAWWFTSLGPLLRLENVTTDPSAFTDVMLCLFDNGKAELVDCTLTAVDGYKLVWVENAVNSLVATNCTFSGKSAWGHVCVWRGSATLNNCRFEVGVGNGHAVQVYRGGGTVEMNGCMIDERENDQPGSFCVNMPDQGPDGAQAMSTVHLTNSVLLMDSANVPAWGGPCVILDWGGTLSMTHCTVAADGPSELIFAVMGSNHGDRSADITLRNNLFYLPGSIRGAVPPYGGASVTTVTSGTNLRFVADPGNDMLTGDIIDADPNLATDLYHLIWPSPAINAGVDVGIGTDIEGVSRTNYGEPDLGAVESTTVPVELSEFSVE